MDEIGDGCGLAIDGDFLFDLNWNHIIMITLSKPLILASASPRRQELMERAGIPFKVLLKDVSEDYPADLKGYMVAEYIAQKKANAYDEEVELGETIVTADTIVVVDDVILGKPADSKSATDMLRQISGRKHDVITAVCIRNLNTITLFHEKTEVCFRELEFDEMTYYVEHYKPFDKAGGYGIQEWSGHIGITSIHGSYDNVVGFPVARLWAELLKLKSKLLL